MKYLIFDAGPIISMAMNGLLPILEKLKEVADCEFILTPAVKREVIDKPIKVKKFKLEALKVQSLLNRGVFKMSQEIVNDNDLNKETKRIIKAVNGILRSEKTNEKIMLIHEGEAACLAFANLCKSENLIVIDERTTRMIFESAHNMKQMMEHKLHCDLVSNFDLLNDVGKFRFVRSAEIVFMAYKKDLIGLGKGREVMDGLLYALKFRGTTISSKEIDVLKGLI
jgi:hypothetical protein